MKTSHKLLLTALAASSLLLLPGRAAAESFLVRDGKPMAEIVTAENPPGSVRLAANELQTYIEKISGAHLPIREGAAGEAMPVQIFVGPSPETDRLGVDSAGLKWGAYRIKSGANWLVLLGDDTVFEPRGLMARNRQQWQNQLQQEWQTATGASWQNPLGPSAYTKYSGELGMSRWDEKGTLNAVYGFLKDLGVRWYMPGELGEVVPEMKTIPLPEMDETVRPDYDIRMVSFARFGLGKRVMDDILWTLRLGFNDPFGYSNHHGLSDVTRSPDIRKNHPEFFALYNNERNVTDKTANACLSSEGLFQETLRFVRSVFDMYDVPVVSVWPDDGFSSICQCELCEGKATPERGPQGVLSDYVWDFINRIAIEVAKTHPGKFVSGGAYSTYLLPPTKIDKFSPNVLVYVVNGRRRFAMSDADLQSLRELSRTWQEKTGNPVITFMNHGGGANTPRLFAGDIQNLKGVANGEDLWVESSSGQLAHPGFNHLNVYVSGLYQWDADQDIDQVLAEYFTQFYGPAADEMAEFIAFFEQRQGEFRGIDSAPLLGEALGLFDKAKAKADPDSVYGRRIALFEEGLKRFRDRYELIKAGRVDVPTYAASRDPEAMGQIKIDGKLDEAFWQDLDGSLKDTVTGEAPEHGTQFKIGVTDNHLYVGIRCEDVKGQPFNAVLLDKNDSAIWLGDCVEFLLETPEHSFYQITVNPKGATANLDRGEIKSKWFDWDAQAEIAAHEDEQTGIWTVEMKIPYTPSTQDPLHEVIGPPPSAEKPWHFNVGRQRSRDQRTEVQRSTFSPTGEATFHNVLKFGRLE